MAQQEISSLFQKYTSVAEASKDLVPLLNEEVEKYLTPKQYEQFNAVQLKTIHQEQFQKKSKAVVSEFSMFMNHLKQRLKAFRIAKKSNESATKVQSEFIETLPENPLDAELYLLKIQWHKLESLSIGHYSDLSALILYKLKLQVLLRLWSFNEKVGFDVFQKSLKAELYGE
jgi:hypothetical protein